MHKKARYVKPVCLSFLLCLLFTSKLQAQATAHCDSLIVSGIDYMWKKDHVKSLELLTQAKNQAEKTDGTGSFFSQLIILAPITIPCSIMAKRSIITSKATPLR